MLVPLCPRLHNSVSTYRKRFWELEVIRSTSSHVMALWLIFEANLIHIILTNSTRLSRVVKSFKHVYLTLYIECVLNKQVRSSRQVDFVIRATFQEWNGNCAINGNAT